MTTIPGASLGRILTPIETSLNAPNPLEITSYDGSGQNVHPDVVYIPEDWCGHPYWMVMTAYPFCQDRFENPALRASNDGLTWFAVDGVPDPLVLPPVDRSAHHADPDLVWSEGALFVFYMTTDEAAHWTTFSVIHSRDGRIWSAPEVIYRGTLGVSPAVVVEGRRWRLWYVLADSSNGYRDARLVRRERDAQEPWGSEVACRIYLPGYVVWHLDVLSSDRGYEALAAAFPSGEDPSRCVLFHLVSQDGLTFRVSQSGPILRPSRFGWDNRMIYRSTFLRTEPGRYRVWYSAMSWGKKCGIGLLEGPLHDLRSPTVGLRCPHVRAGSLLRDLKGWLRYRTGRILRSRSW